MDQATILAFAFYSTVVWIAVVYDMSVRRGIKSWPWMTVAAFLGPMALVPLFFIPVDPEHSEDGLWAP